MAYGSKGLDDWPVTYEQLIRFVQGIREIASDIDALNDSLAKTELRLKDISRNAQAAAIIARKLKAEEAGAKK